MAAILSQPQHQCILFQAFIKQRNYSDMVQVTKVHEKAEPAEFKALFKFWEKEKLPGANKPFAQNRIGKYYVCYGVFALVPR